MKRIFISAEVKNEPNYSKLNEAINKEIQEQNLAICYSNQFVEVAKKIEKLAKKNIVCRRQILGCSNPIFPKETTAILAITEGNFHAVSLAYESGLPAYLLEGETLKRISSARIGKMKQQERGAYLKFLNAENVGIIISTKPGQERLHRASDFAKSLKNKQNYLFIANDLNPREFENFGIDSWINTACPRMDLLERGILNLSNLEKLQSLEN